MKHALLIPCLFLCAALSAQTYIPDWRNCFDNGERFAQRTPLQASATDSADNLYITGFVNLHRDPIYDSIYLRKYNPAGNLLWEIYEPFKDSTVISSIAIVSIALTTDKNGNAIISYPYSFTPPDVDAVVCKYNVAGKKLWQTVFDGPVDVDDEEVRKLNTDDEGNIYLLAARSLSYYHYADIVKFNGKGKMLWYRDMTGIYDFDAKDATLDSSGNVYITGSAYTSSRLLYSDILTYKFLSNGQPAWRKVFDSYYSNTAFRVIYAKQDNSIILCGHQTDQNGTPDSIFAIKYLTGGKLLWSYHYRPARYQTFNQSVLDEDNNVLIASSQTISGSYTGPFLTKISSAGLPLWSKYDSPGTSVSRPHGVLDLKTDVNSNYYAIVDQPEGVLIQKFDKSGSLLTQMKEGIDTSVYVNYAALNLAKNQNIYAATSYEFYFARTKSCLSRYTLKKTNAVDDIVANNDRLATEKLPLHPGSIYPNPAHGVIHLSLPVAGSSCYTIRVVDVLGKQVFVSQLTGSETTIDISKLLPGMYVIHIFAGAQQSTYKFIKQ